MKWLQSMLLPCLAQTLFSIVQNTHFFWECVHTFWVERVGLVLNFSILSHALSFHFFPEPNRPYPVKWIFHQWVFRWNLKNRQSSINSFLVDFGWWGWLDAFRMFQANIPGENVTISHWLFPWCCTLDDDLVVVENACTTENAMQWSWPWSAWQSAVYFVIIIIHTRATKPANRKVIVDDNDDQCSRRRRRMKTLHWRVCLPKQRHEFAMNQRYFPYIQTGRQQHRIRTLWSLTTSIFENRKNNSTMLGLLDGQLFLVNVVVWRDHAGPTSFRTGMDN